MKSLNVQMFIQSQRTAAPAHLTAGETARCWRKTISDGASVITLNKGSYYNCTTRALYSSYTTATNTLLHLSLAVGKYKDYKINEFPKASLRCNPVFTCRNVQNVQNVQNGHLPKNPTPNVHVSAETPGAPCCLSFMDLLCLTQSVWS